MNQGKSLEVQGGLIIQYSPITVDAILTPEDSARYNIETKKHRVQLRQTVTTKYPQSRGNALFRAAEFGDPQSFVEKRVTWLDVPEGTTAEEVLSRLNEMDTPTLVKILDLKPIISESKMRAIENGFNTKTLADYAQDYVRKSDTNEPVPFAGRHQYREIVFSDSFVEDTDHRRDTLRDLTRSEETVHLAQDENSAVAQPAGRF